MSTEIRGSGEVRDSSATRIDLTQPESNEPSLGQLVSSATRDLSALVRGEVELAKVELRNEAKHAAKGGAMFGAAAVLGTLAVVLLSCAASLGIGELFDQDGHLGSAALGFLIVGVVFLLLAGILALIGKRQVSKVGPPERTIRTTKESVAVLKGGGQGAR
ncbi:MAG: phage holin family protein [Actinomycetota bacterium]|nr:phage holin family protein [Actinomycetota bacterium]